MANNEDKKVDESTLNTGGSDKSVDASDSKDTKEEPQVDMKKVYRDKLNKQNDEIQKLKFDVEHWKNEYYKAYADMANLRKNIEKDQRDVYKYRIEGFAENLLGVLDAFDMAFKNEASTPELKNYLTGFQYVHNQLIQILTDEGVVPIVPKVGDKFDVNTMHAIETVDDPGEENIVKEVNMKGYKLHDHLIRAAMVVVSKHPDPKKDDKDAENKVNDDKTSDDKNKKVC